MTEAEIVRKLTPVRKAIIFMSIGLVFIVLLIPLFQQGQNHTYRRLIVQSEKNIERMEETERILKSNVALARSPESLIDEVIRKEIDYEAIDASSAILIARGN